MYEIDIYQTEAGKEPFLDWKESLDSGTEARIDARVARLRNTGNFGDFKSLKDGIYELRLDFGPGYRIYYGVENKRKKIVLLLLGGSKKSQSKDIEKAKFYWIDHLSRQERGDE